MFRWTRKIGPFFIACLFAGAMSFFNVLHVLVAWWQTPENSVFIGNAHYWEDYLLYLNHFFQGSHGAWLVANRFTSEPTSTSLVYLTNLLMGKFFFFLSPTASYTFWLFLLGFIQIVSMYLLIKRLTKNPRYGVYGMIYATLATSLINHIWIAGKSVWWPFQIWRTPHFAFDRLGGAPHQMMQTILFLWLCIVLFTIRPHTKSQLFTLLCATVLFALVLTITNPVQAMVFVALLWASVLVAILLKKFSPTIILPPILFVMATTITIVTMFFIMDSQLSREPHIQSKLWEASQITGTTWWFLTLSIGPLLLWVLVGICMTFPIMTFTQLFGILLMCGSYMVFRSPLPAKIGVSDLRFLFPATYAFFGLFAATLHRRIPHKVFSIGLLIVFVLLTLPTLYWEMSQRLAPMDNDLKHITYVPSPVYNALDSLKSRPFDEIVLADPASHMDSLVPALSGHTTYSGHMLATIHNDQKQHDAQLFFSKGFNPIAAQNWLKNAHIKYVITDESSRQPLSQWYPFLSKRYDKENVGIYEIP